MQLRNYTSQWVGHIADTLRKSLVCLHKKSTFASKTLPSSYRRQVPFYLFRRNFTWRPTIIYGAHSAFNTWKWVQIHQCQAETRQHMQIHYQLLITWELTPAETSPAPNAWTSEIHATCRHMKIHTEPLIHADTRRYMQRPWSTPTQCPYMLSSLYVATYEDTYSARGTRKYVQLQTKPSTWTIQCRIHTEVLAGKPWQVAHARPNRGSCSQVLTSGALAYTQRQTEALAVKSWRRARPCIHRGKQKLLQSLSWRVAQPYTHRLLQSSPDE